MKIKKVSQPVAAVGQILNEKSNSEKDTYSAAYIDKITISELSNSQSKFTNIQVNEVLRSGNVVTVDFRGYINENIADSSEFLRLPYAPRDAGTAVAYLGTNYTVSTPVWFYWTTHVKELKGNSMNAENWLHMHFTYITDDD